MSDRAFLRTLQSGDKVVRLISSAEIPSVHTVEKIENGLIYLVGDWMFDAETGIEEDPDLGWGKESGIVASWLDRKVDDSKQIGSIMTDEINANPEEVASLRRSREQ